MYGYRLKLSSSVPQTKWATKVSVDDYIWYNRSSYEEIEIALISAPAYTLQVGDDPPIELHGMNVHCVVGTVPIYCAAEPGVPVEIATIAIHIPDLKWEMKQLCQDDYDDPKVILLPLVTGLSEYGELKKFEQRIHRYIHAYMTPGHAASLQCTGIVYDLLCRLDTMVRQAANRITDKYITYYIKKTNYAIETRYSEKLTINGLAAEFGITPSYLSSIYHTAVGMTFSEQLTDVRIQHAKDLLLHSQMNLSEIAECVGYSSESHLRKRFSRHVGIGITEFLCINKEQTLYHDKPLRITDTYSTAKEERQNDQ